MTLGADRLAPSLLGSVERIATCVILVHPHHGPGRLDSGLGCCGSGSSSVEDLCAKPHPSVAVLPDQISRDGFSSSFYRLPLLESILLVRGGRT